MSLNDYILKERLHEWEKHFERLERKKHEQRNKGGDKEQASGDVDFKKED